MNDNVILLFNEGLTYNDISKSLNIPQYTVRYILKKGGLSRRVSNNKSRKYTLNENFFKDINTETKAYLLGFLMADGSIDEERNTLRLMCGDLEVVTLLQNSLETNKPIRFVKNNDKNSNYKNMYDISICSKVICSDLINNGIIKRKSYFSSFPNISQNLINHFIRGYFDGDGHISTHLTFTGNLNFLTQLKKIIYDLTKIDAKVYTRFPERNNSIITLSYNKKSEIKILKEFLYNNSTVHLKRKHERFPES